MNDTLVIRDFNSFYGKKQALYDIDIKIRSGELCALIGHNGSGKSTLLRSVCGLLRSSGTCEIMGRPTAGFSPRERALSISYLSQQSNIALSLSGLDAVLMGYDPLMRLGQATGIAEIEKALSVMELAGALPYAYSDYASLSRGQQQLVLIARTLVRDTPLLLLDEPDSALDPQNRRRLYRLLLSQAHDLGRSVIICSHDINLAMRYSDRLIMMKEGRISDDITLVGSSLSALQTSFERIYGKTEIIEHRGHFIMTGGEDE